MKKYTISKLCMVLSLALMIVVSLLLPAPFSVLPVLILAAGAAVAATWTLEDEWTSPDWGIQGQLHRDHPLITVDEELFHGPFRQVVDVRLPFETIPPERFRGQQGVLLMSAALALTQNDLTDDGLQSLNIQRQNFLHRFPMTGEVTVNGLTGVVVRDGKISRAYFAAGPELAVSCSLLLAGQAREMTQADVDRIALVSGTHYATAPVEDGQVGPLTYLGSSLGRPMPTVDPGAMEAYSNLASEGYDVRYDGDGKLIHDIGLSINPVGKDKGLLFIPLTPGTVRFDLAMHQLSHYHDSVSTLRVRTLVFCLISTLMGALLGNVLLGVLGVVLACILLPRHVLFHAPDHAAALIGSAALSLILCGVVTLFQQVIGFSPSLCALLVCGWALIWCLMPYMGRPRVHWRNILGCVAVALLVMVATVVALLVRLEGLPIGSLPAQLNLPALGFGLCTGLLIGLVSMLPLLATPVD